MVFFYVLFFVLPEITGNIKNKVKCLTRGSHCVRYHLLLTFYILRTFCLQNVRKMFQNVRKMFSNFFPFCKIENDQFYLSKINLQYLHFVKSLRSTSKTASHLLRSSFARARGTKCKHRVKSKKVKQIQNFIKNLWDYLGTVFTQLC